MIESGSSVLPELIPAPSLQVPDWAQVPHPRPFLCAITPGPSSASRSIPHVANTEYLRWVDRVAELHARQLGLSRESMLDQQRMWFVARHELEYRAECWPGQPLAIATWVDSIGRAATWRATLIWRDEDRRIVFRARTNWVLVDILSRRPLRIDPGLAARLDARPSAPGTPREQPDRCADQKS